jgi:hypothetical protein
MGELSKPPFLRNKYKTKREFESAINLLNNRLAISILPHNLNERHQRILEKKKENHSMSYDKSLQGKCITVCGPSYVNLLKTGTVEDRNV